MSSMEFDTSSHEDELRAMIANAVSAGVNGWVRDEYETEMSEGDYVAQEIIDALGLVMRRDNLSGNGYRVIGKFIED